MHHHAAMMPLCSLQTLELGGGVIGWLTGWLGVGGWAAMGWGCTELMQQNIDKTPEGKAAAG